MPGHELRRLSPKPQKGWEMVGVSGNYVNILDIVTPVILIINPFAKFSRPSKYSLNPKPFLIYPPSTASQLYPYRPLHTFVYLYIPRLRLCVSALSGPPSIRRRSLARRRGPAIM